jgi:hypothetical protein
MLSAQTKMTKGLRLTFLDNLAISFSTTSLTVEKNRPKNALDARRNGHYLDTN